MPGYQNKIVSLASTIEMRRSSAKKIRLHLFLHIIWQTLLYAFPIALLLAISFWMVVDYQLSPTFTLNNYEQSLTTPRYQLAIGNSLRLGLLCGVFAVGFSLPLAHALAFQVGARARRYLFIVLLLPFLSSYVVRMFGWQFWVNDQGILPWIARTVLGMETAKGFLYTEAAVIVGLLSMLIPVATILIFLSLARIDQTLVPAALNLGASRWRAFRSIELPLILPAMLIAFMFCFMLAFGDFICASVLGGNEIYYLSSAIQDRIKINDWPMAAAMGMLLLGVSIGFMATMFTVFRRLPGAKV